jgi:hypothetical protein
LSARRRLDCIHPFGMVDFDQCDADAASNIVIVEIDIAVAV